MKLLAGILVFSTVTYIAYALCNVCSATTGLACVSNTQFATCADGLPTSTVTDCPSGQVCTSTAEVCSPEGSVVPSCDRCGTCSSSNGGVGIACTSYDTYALCLGGSIVATYNFTCSASLVCNIDSSDVCIDPLITGIGATCPSATTTTTTTTAATPTTSNPTVNPQAYCANVAKTGRYEIASDPNCKRYIACSVYNATWFGNLYECIGTTFFNSTSGLCGLEVPERCTVVGTT